MFKDDIIYRLLFEVFIGCIQNENNGICSTILCIETVKIKGFKLSPLRFLWQKLKIYQFDFQNALLFLQPNT